MSKLLKLIDTINAKVEFDKWHKYNYDEWKKCYDNISHWENIFRVGIECNRKINNLCDYCRINRKRKNVCYFK